MPADKNAMKETINLYRNLKKFADKGFIFDYHVNGGPKRCRRQ
jgi:hypothetical protein